MLAFVVRRAWQSVIILFLVSIASFALVLLSGDPVAEMMPTHSTEHDRQVMRESLGLDKPVAQQYVDFVGRALHGDLGRSIKFNEPVLPLIMSKLPSTMLLAVLAIVLATLIAVPLGLFTGTRAGSTSDTLGTVFAVLTVSVPTFWLGLMLILFLGDYLRWLPVSGSGGPANLIMPVITLAAFSAGFVTRVTRASVIEELHHNYVVTARSKGLGSWRVNYRHVLRNVLIPTVTIVALQLGHLLGGSVIVETVFAWPGAGWLLMQGVFARDLPVVRGMVLIIGATFILLNLMVDIAYRYIDPRIRY